MSGWEHPMAVVYDAKVEEQWRIVCWVRRLFRGTDLRTFVEDGETVEGGKPPPLMSVASESCV
jgi:hypothetical protein